MLENQTIGVYCLNDMKFYYMDAGNLNLANPIDRIKKALTQRGLIRIDPETMNQPEQYQVMKAGDAKLKSYEIVPIYLNEHIRVLAEQGKQAEPKAGRWSKK